MTTETMQDRTMAERETAFLKRTWWVLPLLGAIAGVAWKMRGWSWIALDPSLERPFSFELLRMDVLAVAALFAAAPLAWFFGIRIDRRLPGRFKTFTLPLLLAAVCLVGADVALRHPSAQNPFWLGLRARLQPGYADYYARELAYWRLDLLEGRKPGPALVVAGSSQVLHGLDFDELRAAFPEISVLRRATAGMDQLKACSAQERLTTGPGDTLVLCVSELDVIEPARIDSDWMRPLVTWRGLRDVVASLRPLDAVRQWRRVFDLALACSSELWASRDYVDTILARPWGAREASRETAEQVFKVELDHYTQDTRRRPYVQEELRALERLLGRMTGAGVNVVVFEGRVNPVMFTPDSLALREEVRGRLAELSRRLGFTYVPESAQDVDIAPSEWADGTHLNDAGRDKFTKYLAATLADMIKP
jgi:hypothetical protein